MTQITVWLCTVYPYKNEYNKLTRRWFGVRFVRLPLLISAQILAISQGIPVVEFTNKKMHFWAYLSVLTISFILPHSQARFRKEEDYPTSHQTNFSPEDFKGKDLVPVFLMYANPWQLSKLIKYVWIMFSSYPCFLLKLWGWLKILCIMLTSAKCCY